MEGRLTRQHPIWEVLEHRGTSISWLIRATGFSASYVYKVRHGTERATIRFRVRCAEVLGLPERLLFVDETREKEVTHAAPR